MPNELVLADIWGSACTASHGHSYYFLTCYDDLLRLGSRYHGSSGKRYLQVFL
jgi:hypothetical protein